MPIRSEEKTDLRRSLLRIRSGSLLDLVVAVERTPAAATIVVTDIQPMSGKKTWQISNEEFMQSGGRVTKQLRVSAGSAFKVDFMAYASGPDARVLFKAVDAEARDRFRRYKENDGGLLFDPWAVVSVEAA